MYLNVSISGLLACLMGLSAAEIPGSSSLSPNTGVSGTSANSMVLVQPGTFAMPAVFAIGGGDKTIYFDVNYGAKISAVKLKQYKSGSDDIDKIIAEITLEPSAAKPPDAGGKFMIPSDDGALSDSLMRRKDQDDLVDGLLKAVNSDLSSLTILWQAKSSEFTPFLNEPLYLESAWTNQSASGTSTTQFFAAYTDSSGQKAKDALTLTAQDNGGNAALPAKPEVINPSSTPGVAPTSEPSTSSIPGPSPTPKSNPTTQPGLSSEPQSLPAPGRGGLGKNGIIGVAVGVTVGGLLVVGTLVWLFFYRRRRNNKNKAHHVMPSYGSDVGVHAMMPDKEMPVVLQSSTQSAYGGEGRPSTDPYAPYSDRASTPPTPHHHPTTGAADAATTQMDHRSTSTPTPAITARYAHLVEEGMTEEEIRRLEEEERQLDAAIENAGRRGGTP